MSKRKIEKRLPEPQQNSSAKVDVTTSSPAFAKPHVVCCQSPTISIMELIKKECPIVNGVSDVSNFDFNKHLEERGYRKINGDETDVSQGKQT